MRQPPVHLCILAGGRSSRFGASKLNIQLEGQPIAAWLLARLRPIVTGETWLSAAPGKMPPGAGAFDRVFGDRTPFAGPLMAMRQILAQPAVGSLVIFAAADMPMIERAHVTRLIRMLQVNRSLVGVMSRWVNGPEAGRIEPLPCVLRAGRGRRLLEQACRCGLRGPQQLASRRQIGCVNLAHSHDEKSYLNINRQEDMAALASRISNRRLQLSNLKSEI